MSTIYLVTSGEYSDYGVVAVFSTRQAAEKAVDNGLGDRVEERPLDPELVEPPPGMNFLVRLDSD